jgi:hypothetical protein
MAWPPRMPRWIDRDRQLLFILPLYAFLSVISLRMKLAVTPLWFTGYMVDKHQALMHGVHPNNEQSRVLQYLIPEAIRLVTGASVANAYAFQRWLFIFLAFAVFHQFMRKWLRPGLCFAGASLLAALIPFTHRAELQESAPLLALMFVSALWAIRDGKKWSFCLLLLVGALVNETILVLAMGWYVVQAPRLFGRGAPRAAVETAILSAPAFLAAGAIRYATRLQPHLGGAWHLPDNIHEMGRGLLHSPFDWYRLPHLGIFFLFSVLWIYPFIRFRAQPHFFRRMSLVVPVFVVAHMLTGIILETRQMIPLAFLLIPMSLLTMFPEDAAQALPGPGAQQ